jgi:ribosomal protein L44E
MEQISVYCRSCNKLTLHVLTEIPKTQKQDVIEVKTLPDDKKKYIATCVKCSSAFEHEA